MNEKTINELYSCAMACDMCYELCLQEEDVQMMTECITLDRDCADICRLTAAMLSRNSDHTDHLMKECIDVCEACANECAKHENEHCKKCAEACNKCAKSCKQFTSVAH
jgi:hypothetical protein